jgi:enoyl-CoA hydratase/carnithine racemase
MELESDSDGVRAECQDRIAVWTLARPERSNALSRAVLRRLGRLARAAGADRQLRAVIITGEGDKAFCAGADLKERKDMALDDVRETLYLYQVAFGTIDRLDKPVIAAINGVAFGGGLELALSCDIRVMAHDAKIGLTETSLGIIPGAGGTQRLPRLVGISRAKQMVLWAERLAADEALRIGLVDRVAAPGENVRDVALAWAAPFRTAAPIALGAALQALDGALDLSLEAGLEHERTCYERTLVSADRVEALTAFSEKRTPRFSGT